MPDTQANRPTRRGSRGRARPLSLCFVPGWRALRVIHRPPQYRLDVVRCDCQCSGMTETAKKLLETLYALPEPERQEVAREILRRTVLAEHGWLEDAELVALADEVFRELDHAEEPR